VVGGAAVVGAAVTVVMGPSLLPVVVGPASDVVGRRLVVGRGTVVEGTDGRVIDVIDGSDVPPLVHAAGTAAVMATTAPAARRGARAEWRRDRGTAAIPSAATTDVTTRDE
jgi:hypothetical protein